jgi:hypothetical protein
MRGVVADRTTGCVAAAGARGVGCPSRSPRRSDRKEDPLAWPEVRIPEGYGRHQANYEHRHSEHEHELQAGPAVDLPTAQSAHVQSQFQRVDESVLGVRRSLLKTAEGPNLHLPAMNLVFNEDELTRYSQVNARPTADKTPLR